MYNLLNLDMLNLMPDDILLDIAHTCEAYLGREGSELKDNLEFVRKIESQKIQEPQESTRAPRGD